MDSFYKTPPRLVSQTYDTSCWAAVIESWVAAIVPQRKYRPTQSELLDSYTDMTFDDGSLDPDRLNEGELGISSPFGMAAEWIAPSRLTADYVATKLRTFGHLVIGYSRGRKGGHVVIIYGVGRPNGGAQMISVMDPDSSTGGYKNRAFDVFKGLPTVQGNIFIGWPKPGLDPNQY